MRHRLTDLISHRSQQVSRSFHASPIVQQGLVQYTEEGDGIASVLMQRAPVNSLSLEMMQAISKGIKRADDDASVHSLILKSAQPSVFSAGLDLKELHQPQSDRLRLFWRSFQQLYLDLYGSRVFTIAAIQGHAPAAGCMLALSCDYRIMSSTKAKIGLNESLLGIVAPPWLAQQYVDTIGQRPAELGLCLGTLFAPEVALDIGLVDEVVDDTVEHAMQRALEWKSIPTAARTAAKHLVRRDRVETLKRSRQQDEDDFCRFVVTGQVQETLAKYLANLAAKK